MRAPLPVVASLALLALGPVLAPVAPAGERAPSADADAVLRALPDVDAVADVRAAAARLPLLFVERRGAGGDAGFVVAGRDVRVELRAGGLTYHVLRRAAASARRDRAQAGTRRPLARHAVTLRFVGADPAVEPVGEAPQATRVHRLVGDESAWQRDLATFRRVVYRDLWPGIDLVYAGEPNRLKHEFVVRPGADPARIRLAWEGAAGVEVEADGSMRVDTPAGALRDARPFVYQDGAAGRREVASAYALEADGRGGWTYGFTLGAHDPALPLVVDPAQIVWATYLGSQEADRALGVAVDRDGCAYVTGAAPSEDTQSYDAFVAKLTPDGSGFVYLTAVGGKETDEGFDLAVDATGAAYVTGVTGSRDFPCKGGLPRTFGGGDGDAFVFKLAPDGKTVVFSGYVGGAGNDFAEGVAVDAKGDVYLEGPTQSSETTFPVAVGPDLTHNGGWDLFVAKVKADGAGFHWAGFVGGDKDDIGLHGDYATAGHLAVDAAGAVHVSGETTSTQATFPTGQGFGKLPSFDATHNGGWDAYVVKVKPDGTGLAWAGYVGGDALDMGFGMGVDAAGNAVLTGQTESKEATFPTGQGFGRLPGFDRTHGGMADVFVAKVKADGTALLWATYLGGPRNDNGNGLVLDALGHVIVAGHAESPDFPTVGGPDLTFNGPATDGDAFVAQLSPDGTKLLWSSFLGGAADDHAFWVTVDAAGDVYVCGDTPSKEDSFPDGDGMAKRAGTGMAKTYQGGDWDGFLVKIKR